MKFEALLAHLEETGVRLWLDGDKLRYSGAKDVLTPKLLKQMKLSKGELLIHIRATDKLADKRDSIPQVPRERDLPLSPDQESPWFLDRMLDGNPSDYLRRAYRLTGSLDIAALQRAINVIVERHEILRTVFRAANGKAWQKILEPRELRIEQNDLRDFDSAKREAVAQELCMEESERSFDLGCWPLMRVRVLRLTNEQWVLVLVIHHMIADGQSFDLMFAELEQCYDEFCGEAKAQLPALPIQYADFAAWRRQKIETQSMADQFAYWKNQFQDRATVLNLPTDQPRPAVQSAHGARCALTIPVATCEQMTRLGREEGATLFMVLLTVIKILLHRYTGQEQILVGTPVSMRNRPELSSLIGLVVNMLVLGTTFSGNLSFRKLLRLVRQTVLGGIMHQDVPFERLVSLVQPERDLSRNPLFQVMLQMSKMPTVRLTGLTITPFEFDLVNSPYDISFHLYETDEGLDGHITYDTDLFAADRIDRMAKHFQILLHGAIADPDQALADLPLLTDDERHRQLVTWNNTSFEMPVGETIHELFEARAGLVPDTIAIRDGDNSLTFSELNRRSNRLAHYLISNGAGPGTVVAIYAKRSAHTLAGLLGILKSGSAYLPLDPTYPPDRLAFMLEDSKAALLVIENSLRDSFPATQVPTIFLDDSEFSLSMQSDMNPLVQIPANSPAYIIYTSGSTGVPKGVIGLHRGSVNRFRWMWERYPFVAGEVCAQKTALSFVDHVWEVFGPLLQGIPLVVIPDEALREPAKFVEYISREGVTRLVLVPSLLRTLLDLRTNLESRLPKLTICITSGEVLPTDLAERFLAALPGVKLLNLYGSSEVAADVTAREVSAVDIDKGTIPIGRPIFNTKLYVLDPNRRLLPVGIPGELYVGGVQLADGYLHRSELTKSCFIENPFDNTEGSRLYRTGDLVIYTPDGLLEYLGRLDQQIKVRGYRIEPGEIEQILIQHPAVHEAVVTDREDIPGNKRIVAYYISNQQTQVSSMRLKDFLRDKLPGYMVPSSFVQVTEWPLTPSMKVDRRALVAPEREHYSDQGYAEPNSHLEKAIASIWQEFLGLETVGIHDDFFELGGDSLLGLAVVAKIKRAGIPLTPRQIFEHPTIAELAALALAPEPEAAQQGEITGPVNITPAMHRFLHERGSPCVHRWNLATLLEAKERIDRSHLELVAKHLLDHHDALRLRFSESEGVWQASNPGFGHGSFVSMVDISHLSVEVQKTAIETHSENIQASFNLSEGPILNLTLFDLGIDQPQQLFVAAHHFILEGLSWIIFWHDLETAYRQLSSGQKISFPPKTHSFKEWTETLRDYAKSAELRKELSYWVDLPWSAVRCLPTDFPVAREYNTNASAREVCAAFTEEETDYLLFGSKDSDPEVILTTALAQSLSGWTGSEVVLFDQFRHGRDTVPGGIDTSHTIGFFLSHNPMVIDLSGADTPEAGLASVQKQLRNVPNKGYGYDLLRCLSGDPELKDKLDSLPRSEVVFNYRGRLTDFFAESALFRFSPKMSRSADDAHSISIGSTHDPRGIRYYPISIAADIVGGRLIVKFVYSDNLHRLSTITELRDAFTEFLQMIAGCLEEQSARLTRTAAK